MKSVTVAIPAYNEEQNIESIIMQIIAQVQDGFKLNKIMVFSDGSVDKTNKIVKQMSRKNSLIELQPFRIREGKVKRLNQIYKYNKSDILFTFDGDIAIIDNMLLSKTVKFINQDKKTKVVAIHQVPIKTKSFIGKSIYGGYELWDNTRLAIKNQDHIQNLYGAATAYTKDFLRTFKFPAGITDDRGYLYIKAKDVNGFKYFKETEIYYLPVSTLHDFWKLSDRSFNKNQETLKAYFGNRVDDYYYIPYQTKLRAIVTTLTNNPLYGLLGFILNLLVRLFPLRDKLYSNYMWEISKSTKKRVTVHYG